MNIEELKSRYDGKTVQEIESSIKSYINSATDYYRMQIGALFYLERTAKFRESPGFKGADFGRYLRERWNIGMEKYRAAKLAFIQFPDESEKYGAGFVASISRKCGSAKVPLVLNALRDAEERFSKPLSPERRDAVLFRFAQTPTIKKDFTDWRAMYLAAEKTIVELRAEVAERDEQIEKLKRALEARKSPPVGVCGTFAAAM